MTIPKEVKDILASLKKAGFEAYIVGGCVRDFLLDKEPKDWDITTNAKPEEIQTIFPHSFYENNFLTVTVKTESKKDKLQEIEITTFRSDATYSDKRHPDQVQFAKTIEEDLSRRDFTVNAIAIDLLGIKKNIIDPFNGAEDLHNKIIKTVGDADTRFSEDALRMLRAIRFAAVLEFEIEEATKQAIIKNSVWLEAVSKERIRDEFVKMIMSPHAYRAIELLRELNLLKFVLPELLENYGVGQNKHHIYDCYEHALRALDFAVQKNLSLQVRLASLLHDIGKPRVKAGDGVNSTFYNHEVVGAKMSFEILTRLKFPKKDIEHIAKLVRHHLFYYNVDEVTESSVRRLMRNMGPENMEDLLHVRQADRIGSGVPKAEPYKLRHLKYIIDKVSSDPISVKMLNISGNDLMQKLGITPGPKIGQLLDILLGIVLEDPKKNTKEFLEKEATRLNTFNGDELRALAEKSQQETQEVQTQEDESIKKKYWVK